MMTRERLDELPEEQRQAFLNLCENMNEPVDDVLERSHAPGILVPYIGVPDCYGSMFIGIEPDGYTHS